MTLEVWACRYRIFSTESSIQHRVYGLNSYVIERLDQSGLVHRALVATRKQSLSRAFPMSAVSQWEKRILASRFARLSIVEIR